MQSDDRTLIRELVLELGMEAGADAIYFAALGRGYDASTWDLIVNEIARQSQAALAGKTLEEVDAIHDEMTPAEGSCRPTPWRLVTNLDGNGRPLSMSTVLWKSATVASGRCSRRPALRVRSRRSRRVARRARARAPGREPDPDEPSPRRRLLDLLDRLRWSWT